jgi:hypothetical protein
LLKYSNSQRFSAIFERMRTVFFAMLMISSLILNAQTDSLHSDSVMYVQGFSFRQGVYLNYEQFRSNRPLSKSALVFEGDSSRFDYIRLALGKESFQWKDSAGTVHSTKTSSLWGYSENKAVYIQWNGAFNRVMVIGSICHFAAEVTTYMYTGPGSYPNQQSGTPVESMQQFVIDTKTGTVYDFNVTTMNFILQRDPVLFSEYSSLKKKQKKEQAFVFLRKYNEKHPLYFLK